MDGALTANGGARVEAVAQTRPAVPAFANTTSIVAASPTFPAIGEYPYNVAVIVPAGFVADRAADVGRTSTPIVVPAAYSGCRIWWTELAAKSAKNVASISQSWNPCPYCLYADGPNVVKST